MSRGPFKPIGRFLASLSLTAKGVLVVAIPLGALMVAVAVFYNLERQTCTARDWVEHSVTVRSEIRQVILLLANAETGISGYLLTRREDFLQPYLAARDALPARLANLKNLLRGNPPQAERLARVRMLIGGALTSLDASRQDAAEQRVSAGVDRLEQGQAELQELRRNLSAMVNEEQRLLGLRLDEEAQAERRVRLAVFGGGTLGLLGGLSAMLLFTTGIERRVRQLEEAAGVVAAGGPIAGQVTGRDAIAHLGRTLKTASELLAARTTELRAAHDELESRVERRTAELRVAGEELHKAHQLQQAIVQSSPLAVWTLDLQGKVVSWNPAAEKIFGWTEAEVIGLPLPVIPDDQWDEFRLWLDLFRQGESLVAVERKRRRRDGSLVDVSIWTAPLRDTAGDIIGTLAIDSDITEHRILEEQFRQSQKLEAVGQLAGGVAHDFNNLLTIIMGYVEMLIGEAHDRPELVEYAHEIRYSASRASALTAQLLAFSRRQISRPKVLDLNEVVTHSAKLLRRVIGEDIEIDMRLAPDLGRVKADPIHIDQVIMNLVVNARDAMGEGGRLTIETANVTLDELYPGRHMGVQPGTYTMLAVSDTGVGMAPEVRSRVFEPFFTTKEAGRGTGLGLSIVYGIVKQNNGEIMVYSEPGNGTTFKIYLPMVEVAAEMAADGRVEDLRGSETLLACEDEERIRKLVRTMLALQGYVVLDADGPQEAVRLAGEHQGPIDLLVTDIVMPRMSGFELARTLRESRPAMRVLYMSGYTDVRVSSSWLLDPGTPFLHKPFTASSLAQKVREALGNGAAAEGGGGRRGRF